MKPHATLFAMMQPSLVAALQFAFILLPAAASEFRASSRIEIEAVLPKLLPGDRLILSNGVWNHQAIVLRGKGTDKEPITVQAETPGKVLFTGDSSLLIDGDYLVVSGLAFREASSKGDAIRLSGRNSRLTETAVTGGNHKFLVHLSGTSNRLDHCYLAGKTNDSPSLQIEAEGRPNHHQVDHNHFGPRPPLGRNGGETIRVGYSGQSMNSSATLVEQNLFDRCDGELEIISSKSCDNIYRGNTFFECAGTLTLRHGNRCRVERNFFLGHHKKGGGGIRVIGEDHTILNNYLEGIDQAAFWITSGIPDSPLNGYFQARHCLIAFNSLVDSSGPAIELDAGIGRSGRTLRPEKITVANNLFALGSRPVLKGKEGDGFRWLGNLADSPSFEEHSGIRAATLKLMKGPDGLFRPPRSSPAAGAAEGSFPDAILDVDGQTRAGRWDVGCDQASDAAPGNRPLTAADVGPRWLEPGTRH